MQRTRPDNLHDLAIQVALIRPGPIVGKSVNPYIAARESRINLMRNTVTNTRSLHMTVVSDVARVRARRQSITSSQSALDATTAGYEVGTRNVVDVPASLCSSIVPPTLSTLVRTTSRPLLTATPAAGGSPASRTPLWFRSTKTMRSSA